MSSPRFARTPLLAALSLVVFAACPPANPGEDGGAPPPDPCNSVEDALGKAECNLPTTGAAFEDFVGTPNDVDWFRIELPAGLTQRDLIRVRGAYTAQQTAVNLTVAVLQVNADGSLGAGLGRQIDRHGQGAPRPVELLFQAPGNPGHPTTAPTRLLVQVSDENANPTRPNFDDLQPYTLTVERVTDADSNEPNDTTATLIPLPGSATGLLSVQDDVDLFAVDVPAPGAQRNILHVQLTAPAPAVGEMPPPYRLMFELRAPDGTPLSENILEAGAQAFAVDLATARLAPAGRYTIAVKGYRRVNDPDPVPGDLDSTYTLNVNLFTEEDVNEPNDVQAEARVIDLGAGPGALVSRVGRLDHVPDPEWFRLDLGALNQPSLLYYRVVPLAAGGRYEPLSDFPDRQVQLFSEVTGFATRELATEACVTGNACPAGWTSPGNGAFVPLIEELCENHDPPRCLQSLRAETPVNPNLNNFSGQLHVPPHAGPISLFLVVQDLGNDWADDRDYRLEVQWKADPSEAARYSGGVEQTPSAALAYDSDGTTFPIPPAGATTVSGTLSHGHGLVSNANKILDGRIIRGVDDYDAVPTDVDSFEFTLPSVPEHPMDRTWELEWTMPHHDGGLPHELALEVTFCDGDRLDGGACTPVRTTQLGNRLVLAYSDEDVVSWHNNSGAVSSRQPAWDRTVGPASTTTTAAAYGCFCFEPRFVRGGTLKVDVVALDRVAYEPVTYTLRMAMSDYPKSYVATTGEDVFCPAPDAGYLVLDGGADGGLIQTPGCRFTIIP